MGVKHERRRHKKVDDGDESASHADSQDSGGRQDVSEQLTLIESAMEAGGVGLNSKKKKRNLPWEALSEPEKRWRIIERVNYPFDLANAAFFVYVGFIHFADDDVMDPLAWQLAWGSAAILTMMKVAIVFRNAISCRRRAMATHTAATSSRSSRKGSASSLRWPMPSSARLMRRASSTARSRRSPRWSRLAAPRGRAYAP